MRRRSALAAGAAAVGTAALPSVTLAHAAETPSRGTPEPYEPLDSLGIDGAREAVVSGDGETIYLAALDGVVTVDAGDPEDLEVLAERRGLLADRENGPLRGIQDVSVDADRLLVVGPAHGNRALRAALVYDVGDPSSPERVAVHETDYPIHNAFLDGGYAYLTGNDGEGNPLVIVDAETPEVVAEWSIVDRDAAWSEVAPALRPLHDVWVGDGVAVLAYWDAGTVLLDVSDPASPAFLARIGERDPVDLRGVESPGAEARALPGNDHYARLDPGGDLLAIGREAWSTDPSKAPGGIDLWDVSDLDSPSHLARIDPPPTPDPSFGGVWTTAHNFDLANKRLYSSWYQGGVKIHDLSDPGTPEEIAWWRDPSETRFWTAQRAEGFVVASTVGLRGTVSGLYTFPDRPGVQPNPPSLSPTPTGPETPTATPHRGTGHSHVSSTPTPTRTPAETPSEPRETAARPTKTTGRTVEETGSERTATGGQPGLGALEVLAGLGAGGLLRWFRSRRDGRQ